MLVDQLPFVSPFLKTVGLTHEDFLSPFFSTTFTCCTVQTIPMLPFTTMAVSRIVNFAGLEAAEDLVKEFSGGLSTFRGKRRDVKPHSV
jgi:hypothetical protein